MKNVFLILTFCLVTLLCAHTAHALPAGCTAEVGDMKVEQSDPRTLIIAAGDKTIINFDSFQVNIDERVNFILSDTSTILVRVTGKAPVLIEGSLKTRGTVLFTTSQGINFAPGASADVNRLLVSTLGLSTHNFLNSYYDFERNVGSRAHITNAGVIDAKELTFIASSMSNSGILQVKDRLSIASADSAMLTVPSQGPLDVEILNRVTTHSIDCNGKSVQDAIANTGTLDVADLKLQALTAPGIFINGITQKGIVNARGSVQGTRELVHMRANRNIELCGRLTLGKRISSATSEIISEGSILVSGALRAKGNTVLCAQEDIKTQGDITIESGNLSLIADSGLSGKGSFQQANGTTLSTVGGGTITIQASGESRIAGINSSGGLILEKGGEPAFFDQWPSAYIVTKGVLSVRKGVKLRGTTAPKR